MSNSIINSRTASIAGVLLALPLTCTLLIAKFNIEPFNGLLKTLFSTDDSRMHIAGAIALMASMLLLPVACILNLVPIRRSVQDGNGAMANPVNLVLAVGLLIFIVILISSFVVDQYPCWIGVPNCD